MAVVQEHGVVSKHLLRDITIQWKRTSLTVTCTSLGCYPCFDVFCIPIKTIFFKSHHILTGMHLLARDFLQSTHLFKCVLVFTFFLVVTACHHFYFLGLGYDFFASPCCCQIVLVFLPASFLFSLS